MFVMTSNFKQIIREEILRQRVAWVTWTLIAVNFISWFMVAWLYDLPLLTVHNSYVLLRAGAINGNLLWAGEWWRIVTSQFLHVYFCISFSTWLRSRFWERHWKARSVHYVSLYCIYLSAQLVMFWVLLLLHRT